VTADKWNKARGHIQHLLKIAESTNLFDYKELESIRGFLIYVARTYPAFTPYLKGIHLTLDSWRPGRRGDGWRDLDEPIQDVNIGLTLPDNPPPWSLECPVFLSTSRPWLPYSNHRHHPGELLEQRK
jgi:hypothetical protein